MKTIDRLLLALIALGLQAEAALAHHSVTANFDAAREIEIRGTVVVFNYVSPHASLVVDGLAYENGAVLGATAARWEIESSAVKGLAARGITADTLRPGDTVIVRGSPHRNPELRRANSSTFLAADGTVLGSAAAAGRGAPAGRAAPVTAPAVAGVRRIEGRWIPPFQREGPRSALPLNAAGLAAWESYVQADSPANTCEPMSIPEIMYAPSYLFDIRFGDGIVMLRNEAYDIERRVPLGGDEYAPADPDGQWGNLRGRIEGALLIVESRDFPPSKWGNGAATQVNGGGADVPSSAQKTVVETISVSDSGLELYYDYVLHDPVYMSAPHTARVVLRRTADDAPMVPYDCNVASARQFSRAPGESLLPPD
jgi:hypothetical protein